MMSAGECPKVGPRAQVCNDRTEHAGPSQAVKPEGKAVEVTSAEAEVRQAAKKWAASPRPMSGLAIRLFQTCLEK